MTWWIVSSTHPHEELSYGQVLYPAVGKWAAWLCGGQVHGVS